MFLSIKDWHSPRKFCFSKIFIIGLPMKKYVTAFVACLMMIVLTGCGGPPTIPVSGQVTYQNKPVFPGTVVFMGNDGKTFSGTLDNVGNYRLPAVELGEYQVCIQTVKLANLRGNVATPSQAPLASEVPGAESIAAAGQDEEQPRIREETVPEKFRNANVAIPDKYNDPKTAGLNASVAKSNGPLTIDFKLE